MVSLWPQWHGGLSTAASGSFWKCGVQLLGEACRAELEPLTLLQLLFSGGTAVILLDGFWDQHQCSSTSNLGKNVGHVHLPFSRRGFVNLTAESDSSHLVGGCVYPGENPTFLTLWVLRTHIYQCKGLGEQGGGKIHMDKVIKLLLWHTFLEECWKIFSLMRIWAENFTMWFPKWFLNPALGPAIREEWFPVAQKSCISEVWVLLVQRAWMPRDGVRAQLCAPTAEAQAPDDFFLQTTLLMDVFMRYENFLWRVISSYPPTFPLCQKPLGRVKLTPKWTALLAETEF